MYVIENPTIFEIQEVLDVVAMRTKLNDILPDETPDRSHAEFLAQSWCYLFYDSNYLPLGYCAFFFRKQSPTIAEFCFGATPFCKASHIFAVRKTILRFMRVSLNNRVRVYIENENTKIRKLAEISGFKPYLKKGKQYKNIWRKVK